MSLDRPAAARLLLRRAAPPAPDGTIVDVTVDSAGWEFTEIAVFRLRPGQSVAREADDRERLVLVLEGHAAVTAGDLRLRHASARATSVFDGPPAPGVLVAPGRPVELVAETDASSSSPRRPADPCG